MIKLKHKILLIMLLMLGIGVGSSWGQVLMNIEDLPDMVSNDAGSKYVSNGQLVWPAGLKGNDDANVITAGGKKFLRLKMSNPESNHLKIQFAEGKIHAGDHLIMEVARVSVANQTPNLGFTIVKQTTENNQTSYSASGGYPNVVVPYGDSSDAEKTYKIDYVIKESDINNVGVNLQNIVISGYWWDATAINRIMVVRHSDEESLPEISVIAPTSNTLELVAGQTYVFKAHASGGEVNPIVVWRQYKPGYTTNTWYSDESQRPTTLGYGDELTYAPTTPGMYYIGADAQQLCVESGTYESSAPHVVTVYVHAMPTINVTAPTTNAITLNVGETATFKATATLPGNHGENVGVVWRQYSSASQESAHVGSKLLGDKYNTEYTFSASKPGVYYIGADAQHRCTFEGSSVQYEASRPHIITVTVVDHHKPTVTLLAPTSRILTLEPGQKYTFKAEASSEERNDPTIVWRRYYSATPLMSNAQENTGSYPDTEGTLGKNRYGAEYEFTAPTEPGTYYIGVDAGQICKTTEHWEGSSPCVVTVNVVNRADMNTGYYNYNNRLAAQWNFDICDKTLFQVNMMNNNRWTADYSGTNGTNAFSASDGKVIYTYQGAVGQTGNDTNVGTYAELTYNEKDVIPVAAGLKFKAPAGSIKIQADIANGEATGIHLILGKGVKMYVPYAENTYRNDKNETGNPENNKGDFANCMHHIKRDILYFATVDADGNHADILSNIDQNCIDLKQALFGNNAGFEYVNDKYFKKLNYFGKNGTPCILQFTAEATTIDRIGVNRNLTYSFYSQYIYENGKEKPEPRMRIDGSPTGQKVASVGDATSAVTYGNAIVMTFGGWKSSSNSNSYTDYNGNTVTDLWGALTENSSSVAVDGFSKYSWNNIAPTSESLMKSGSTDTYHPGCTGVFPFVQRENYTPWTLPCRGAYLKFEPTLPGVLNVNVFQKRDKRYYILDEFGNAVSEGVFWKTAVNVDKNTYNAGFKVVNSDSYVKYSFNVYPGKTYYMFSADADAGIGFAGFYFEPYVYRKVVRDVHEADELERIDVKLTSLVLDDNVNYSDESVVIPTASTSTVKSPGTNGDVSYDIYSDNKAVEVTLNRSFTANTWNSICLPFSMNNNSMEKVFGEGTRVVLLRDVQEEKDESGEETKTTANFVAHENQDIIAGYPYFIYPTQDVSEIKTNAYIPAKTSTVHIPSISSEGFNTAIGEGTYNGVADYNFTGSFDKVTAPQGSYYMSANGKLSRCTKEAGVALKSYRACMSFVGTYSAAKAIDSVVFGISDDNVEATDIDEISIEDVLFKNGILTQSANVYNMQGQIVRQNVTNLQGLPKGAYIVNGKKYVIK